MAVIKLNNGLKLPTPVIHTRIVESFFIGAMLDGYRHFFTEIKEDPVTEEGRFTSFPREIAPRSYMGPTLRIRFRELKRPDLTYTTAFAKYVENVEQMDAMIEEEFDIMETDYFDVLLLDGIAFKGDDEVASKQQLKKMMELWTRFEEMYKDKTVRAIGVSEMTIDEMRYLDKHCEIPPMILRTGWFPMSLNKEIYEYCQKRHMQIMSDYPFLNRFLIEPAPIRRLCRKYEVTPYELMNRYAEQNDILPILIKYWRVPEVLPSDRKFIISEEDMYTLEHLGYVHDKVWHPNFTWYKMLQDRVWQYDIEERLDERVYPWVEKPFGVILPEDSDDDD
jgi:diketogulonate reductase-like aldo/keto reductase